MKKNILVAIFSVSFSCCVTAQAQKPLPLAASPGPSTPQESSKALRALLDQMWQDRLSHSPEEASVLGDKRYDDRLTDYSVQAYNDGLARGRRYIIDLSQIDTSRLSDQEKLSADLMLRHLVEEQEESQFKPWEMPLNQEWGPHIELPQLVDQLSFDGAKDYDNYIARLRAIPQAFEQLTANMTAGITDNRVPPKYLLEKVLIQVNKIAAQKPEESPFARPLKKFPAGISADEQTRIHDDLIAAIQRQVLPAYGGLARFIEHEYIPHGRTDPGLWAIPDGDKYYAFLVRENTTTTLSPDQIHKIGLDEVQRDEAEMLAIAQKFGFHDLKSFQTSLASNPKLHATSTDQLIGLYRGYIDRMRPKLPQLFGRLPKAPLEVKPVPSYMEQDQTQAYYYEGTPDGKRPGAVYVNFYKFADRLTTNVEAISYHEGIPGHHLQISIAQELEGLPEFRKHEGYTAFVEGWALYSERLGKEIGFYQEPYSDYGRLEADIWRAIRLVVDTGVHSEHWNRDQVLEYFRAHSSMDDTNIQSEIDRYIAWPGQALGYKIGQLTILRLRAQAQQALGSKFDPRAFHDEVLDSGALPMDVLEQRINDWIAARKSSK
jgi:uncharacterized protein (DUF885 family)